VGGLGFKNEDSIHKMMVYRKAKAICTIQLGTIPQSGEIDSRLIAVLFEEKQPWMKTVTATGPHARGRALHRVYRA